MKGRHIGFLLSFGVLVAQASVGTALAEDKKISEKDLTCQVYGGSFVLDDDDFKAMQDASFGDGTKVTRETFASLAPTRKVAICDTRMIARRLKAGKFDYCDFPYSKGHYKDYLLAFFAESELDLVNKAIDLPSKECR
jgi:hypothetical protein